MSVCDVDIANVRKLHNVDIVLLVAIAFVASILQTRSTEGMTQVGAQLVVGARLVPRLGSTVV